MNWGEPTRMANPSEWRRWLEENHGSASEIFLLIVKERSLQSGLRYEEAVEEALCFGWIDGIARRFDDDYSLNRFTPRRSGSNWSASNRDRLRRLAGDGRITPAGLAAVPDDVRAEVGLSGR